VWRQFSRELAPQCDPQLYLSDKIQVANAVIQPNNGQISTLALIKTIRERVRRDLYALCKLNVSRGTIW
jgi:hypothetical protein